MTGHILNLVRWEWFKLRPRWMPWILLVILVLFSQMAVWGSFFGYRSLKSSGGEVFFPTGDEGRGVGVGCNDLLAGRTPDLPSAQDPRILAVMRDECQRLAVDPGQGLQELRAGFTPSSSIPSALVLVQAMGLILIAILAASTLGTDYGSGTLRSVLVKGTGRWQYLAAKFALLAMVAAGALVISALVILGSAWLAEALIADSVDIGSELVGWSDIAISLGKSWFALLPYVALATCIVVLTTSSAAGMAIAIGYYLAEQITVAILFNAFDRFKDVADYLLTRNIAAWILSDQKLTFSERGFFLDMGNNGQFPGELHAFLVLAAYILLLGGLAFWLFQRRDVAGASGG